MPQPLPSRCRCRQCGALVPDTAGPVHAYVPSAPGCWAMFGEVQADEMMRFRYPDAHRLVVDAYMAQHPGDGADRRDRQSVAVHLIALCGALEHGWSNDFAIRRLRAAVTKGSEFPLMGPRAHRGALTIASMVGARDLDDYNARALAWARCVWESWSGEHERVRGWLADPGPTPSNRAE